MTHTPLAEPISLDTTITLTTVGKIHIKIIGLRKLISELKPLKYECSVSFPLEAFLL